MLAALRGIHPHLSTPILTRGQTFHGNVRGEVRANCLARFASQPHIFICGSTQAVLQGVAFMGVQVLRYRKGSFCCTKKGPGEPQKWSKIAPPSVPPPEALYDQRAAKGSTQKGVGHLFLFRSPFGKNLVTSLDVFCHFFCLSPFASSLLRQGEWCPLNCSDRKSQKSLRFRCAKFLILAVL